MVITGARVFDGDRFTRRDLYIRKGRISEKTDGDFSQARVLDAQGLYAIPGLVDIHIHGAAGCDVCDGTAEAIERIAAYEAAHGITSMCLTTMTLPKEKLLTVMRAAREYNAQQLSAASGAQSRKWGDKPDSEARAKLLGIHLEGPFISGNRVGAQNPDFVCSAEGEWFEELQREAGGWICLLTLAPEQGTNMDFIREYASRVHISLGHTDCSYDIAKEAFEGGADHLTHLFNAMPGLHHRIPGPIAAAVEAGAYGELIGDGVHIHPAMVRLAWKLFGAEKMILISDSMRACGLEDGIYELGGQPVELCGNRAVLAEQPEVLAGSVTNLYDCMKQAVRTMGIPLVDAVRAATWNPARAIGVDHRVGSLLPGREADVLLMDEELNLIDVIYNKGKV
ncbi:MAG: N-acetylglucosamine-6-phosphate deacetylase [Lachnospiraceae bacterium]|nr:N-acetylglucosamine-6-phosphate deacetylase [Lachnospiraceae bacterium]